MGDYAEGILDGTFDSITGEYLGFDTWYPVTLERRTSNMNSNWKGVCKWLQVRNVHPNQYGTIVLKYAREVLEIEEHRPKHIAVLIQENFNRFTVWYINESKQITI